MSWLQWTLNPPGVVTPRTDHWSDSHSNSMYAQTQEVMQNEQNKIVGTLSHISTLIQGITSLHCTKIVFT